jgi:F-type H+-transporting ATPase subunit delta
MSQAITTARPYAQAAFEEAQKLSDLKGWSEVLKSLAEAVVNPEVQTAIKSPKVSREKLANFMVEVVGGGLKPQQINLIRVLAENKRLQVLPEIVAIFEVLKAEAEKNVNVVVESAFELSAAQQDKIVGSLKKRMGREIKMTCTVNKELLGGIVVRAGDKVIDGSARTRLSEMANALA